MNFADAREAQQEVFARAFRYVEIAAGTDVEFKNAGPFFANPQALQAAERGETIVSSMSDISVGIGLSGGTADWGRRGANRNFELVVYCQHKRQIHSWLVEQIVRVAHGEVRKIVTGRIRKTSWLQSTTRPLRIGCSVGHRSVSAGTLGCFVKLRDGRRGVLSNNHILANVNHASPGDPILQPGRSDGGGDPQHRVATLHEFVPLKFHANARNFVDAAVATLLPNIVADCSIYDGTAPIGLCDAAHVEELEGDEPVLKIGRTTGLTRGKVQAINVNNVYVAMSAQGSQHVARFDGQIAIEGAEGGSFSKPGDSGALVMTEKFNPVALCFAGSQTGGANGLGVTFANPIEPVLNALDCSILTGTA